ncbi:hypothetical protein ACLPHQ_29995, partial [Pseudomonas aeruginosa]
MTAGGIPFTGNGARLSPGRALLCGLALLLCGGEALARQLPSDMLVGFVASAQYPVITLKKPKQSLLRIEITRTGEASTLGKVIGLMQQAGRG